MRTAEDELRNLRRDIDDNKARHLLGPEHVDVETHKLLTEAQRWQEQIDSAKTKVPKRRNLFASFFQALGVLDAPANSQEFFMQNIKAFGAKMRHTVDTRSSYVGICTVGFYKSFPGGQTVRTLAYLGDEHTSDTDPTAERLAFYERTPLAKEDAYMLCDDLSRICCVVQGHLLHKDSFSQEDQDIVTEIAKLLEESINLIDRLLQIPLCLSVLTNRAVESIESFHQYIRKRAKLEKRETSILLANIAQWKGAYDHFQRIERQLLKKSEAMKQTNHAWMSAQIAEEYNLWSVEAAEDSQLSQGPLTSGDNHRTLSIPTSLFTYKIISEKFTTKLNLCILIKNIPIESYATLQSSSGSFGTVYRVKLTECLKTSEEVVSTEGKLKKINWTLDEVAVKVAKKESGLNESALCIRVAREIRIWSKMKHENIVPLLGLWSGFTSYVGPADYYVPIAPWMEEDLCRYARKQIDKYHRLSLLRDIASALEYMHNSTPAFIHGDLRADNVLVKAGRAYLCDFGISKLEDNIPGFTTKPHGHIRWQPPERVINNMAEPTVYGDMYSFGSVMFETLTGKFPWPDSSDYEVFKKRSDDKYATSPWPKEGLIDEHIRTLIKNCWSFGHNFRPTSRLMHGEILNLMKLTPSTVLK